MKRTFLANLFFVILLNLIVKPLWVLGIDREVQNIVGYHDYGLYFALSGISIIFNILTDMGFTYYNNRHIAQNPSLSRTYFTHIFILKLAFAVLYLCVTTITALFWYNDYSIKLLLALCLNQVMLSFILYFRSNISALHFFRLDSIISITDKTLMILFFGTFILLPQFNPHFNIAWFIYGQSICYFLTLCIALAANIFLVRSFSFSISKERFYEIWKNSYPYVLVIFFMSTYSKIDGVMISHLISNHEAGVYASAIRLLDAATQFGFLFAVLLLPIFSRMIARNNSIESLLSSSFTLIFLFAGSLIMCCLFYGTPIMLKLYKDADAYSGLLLSIVMTTLLGISSVFIFGTLLSANANLNELKIVTGIGVIINISLNLFMIPRYGAAGAGVTAAITNLFVAVTEMMIVKRLFGLKINKILIWKLTLFVLLSLAGSFLIKNYIELKWPLQVAITLLVYVVTAMALRLVDYKDILRFKRLAEG